jgi:hypothetical protein
MSGSLTFRAKKAGDVEDTNPDRDSEQKRIDLADRPVETTQQLSSMTASRGYRLHCHRASTAPCGRPGSWLSDAAADVLTLGY